jgi:amino acid adenylation domain-containing protein
MDRTNQTMLQENTLEVLSDQVFVFPASFAQQRLWFLDKLEPGSCAYNIPFAIRLSGNLSVGVLEQCFQELIRRHEVLRTVFSADDQGSAIQLVSAMQEFHLGLTELRDIAADSREGEAHRLVIEQARKPFDLAHGPLFRANLLRLANEEHILLLTLHHAVFDGWSLGILLHEVSALYLAFSGGKPSPLPDLPIQYGDFAAWQRAYLEGDRIEKLVSYWKQHLAGAPAVLDLPTDFPRPAVQTYRGETCSAVLPKNLLKALNNLAVSNGCTLFMVLLAAFDVLLARYCNQEDVVVGTYLSGRNRSELEPLIGFFVNTLALRTDLSGNPTVHQLLAAVQQTALGAYAHQDLPFEKLVEELQPERNMSHPPVFQATLLLQNVPQPSAQLPGLTLSPVQVNTSTAKVDLSLSAQVREDELRLGMTYNVDLFAADTVSRMLRHFQTLLKGMVADANRPIAELLLLNDRERHNLLVEFNNSAADYSAVCIHQLFEQQVRQHPDAVAVRFCEQSLTYAELNRRANQLARYLQRDGVEPEMLIGLYLERSLDMMVALLGTLKAGAAYVPLDPAYPKDRIAFIVKDARVRLLLTQQHLVESLPKQEATIVCLDNHWNVIAGENTENLPAVAKPENLAYVLYTSGSTGRPKGVQIQHQSVVNFLCSMQREPGLKESDVLLAVTTLSFDIAGLELYLPLTVGARVIVASREEAQDGHGLMAKIENEGVTVMQATPATWRLLLESGWQGGARLKILCGGEAFPRELAEQLLPRCAELWNLYGPTETTIWSTIHRVMKGESGPVSIGRPIANTELYVLNAYREPVPIGVGGELYIGGDGLARGYLNRPELTNEKFVPHPFRSEPGQRLYRTGDLVRFRPDGNLVFLGRIDNQVKIRGFRVELGEIESILSRHPAVQQAVVIVREDVPGDKRLVGYIVAQPGQDPASSELKTHLERSLPDYMVPGRLVKLDTLPLTPNGKVDRKCLPAPEGRPELEGAYVAPRTPVEEAIAGIWAGVLRLERVGAHDDFFALGGHSLLATQVVSRILQIFQVEIPLRAIFESATVAGLARQVEDARNAARGFQAPPLVPVLRTPNLPLSFAQQRLWFLDKLEPNNSLYKLPHIVRLTGGALQVAALEKSLQEIARRHESLRTTFQTVHNQPVQVIAPTLTLPMAVTDLTALAESEREAEARRLAIEEVQRPFDLSAGPLLRASLFKLNDRDHVLILNTHHIISDLWSLGVLSQELAALYEAYLEDQPSPLPELPIQYADYTLWQRQFLTDETLDRQLAYWKAQLEGAPAVLKLPTDRHRPAVQTFQGAQRSVVLPKELLSSLKALSRTEGATLFMTLLAAFNVLLSRYSGQDDIVVGSPIAGRNRSEVEKLIGLFVNTLVLRTDLAGNPSFRELLARVRETAMGAYAHQDLPFEKLVEELKPERDLSRNPLFQIMFMMQNVPRDGWQMPGLTLAPFKVQTGKEKFDLSVSLVETASGLKATFSYNTDLFDATTMERMLGHFQVLLEGIIADPGRRISELPLLTSAERQQIVVDWNNTTRSYPQRCVHELFESQVERTPDAVAVSLRDQELSYRELNRRANRVAHELRRLGVGLDVPVGLCSERSLEMVVGLLGILKAGGAYLPLDAGYPRERIAFMIQDAGVQVLLAQEKVLSNLPEQAATVVKLEQFEPWDDGKDSPNLASATILDNLAYVTYTSGSTGTPKGVEIPHRGVVRLVFGGSFADLDEKQVLLQLAPVAFDASTLEVWGALLHGARCVLYPGDLPTARELGQVLRENQVTTLWLTASLFNSIIDEAPQELSSVRQLMTGGEALSVPHVRRALEVLPTTELINGYGPTESTTFACTYRIPRQLDAVLPSIPIGRPIGNTQVYVLDANLEPAPVGVPGELYIGGDGLARGYLNRPEVTAEKFVPDPIRARTGARLYRTGDLCRCLPDGNIQFLGRLDNQVKVRGFRIELGEIEAALSQHPSVRECVVIAREDRPGDKRLVAYVVPSPGHDASTADLRGFLKASLPEYMIPSAFVKLDAMPLTSNGKINRSALPPPEITQTSAASAVGPRDEFESVLLPIWERVLGTGSIGVTDNFFELGGHSLLAVRLLSEIKSATGKEIPLTALFQGATVEYLAKLMREGTASVPHATVTEIQRGGSRPTFFAVVVPGVNTLGYLALAKCLGTDQPFYMLQGPGPRVRQRPYTAREFESMAADYVRAMREVQPEGPYHIGGMCEGARIAFDMARSLESQGQKVALLAVFDTWVLENSQNRFLWRFYYYSQRLRAIRRLSPADRRSVLSKALRNATRRLLRPSGTTTGNDWPSVYWPGKDFVPPKFNGKITIFKIPKQPLYYVHDPLMGWGARTTVGVEVRLINSRHSFMLREPYVRDLAAELSECLERVRSQAAGESEYQDASVHHAMLAPAGSGGTADSSCLLVAKQLDAHDVWPAIARLSGRNGGPPVPFPVSFAQQRLWVLDRLDPDSPAYNIPLSVRLTGLLNPGALENALIEVARRHEILRTEFHSENGEPMQIVLPSARAPVAVVDLSGVLPAEREAQAVRLAMAEAQKPFNLSRGPLLRASLLRLAKSEHILLVTVHHIAFDEWSVGTLLAEMARFYEAAVRGEPHMLPELPFQYGDFAVWQRQLLQGEQLEQQLSYWKRQLAGAPSGVDLPTDRPRGPMQTFRGASQTVVIAQSVLQRLQDLSRRQGVTLFMTLLAGFNVLLSRYSGQDDLVVGTPIAGRSRLELEKLIGLFVNTLVLRTDMSGDPSFVELLRRVREATIGAYAHQDVPFERLVEELKPERDMSRNPLFQIMLSLRNVPRDGWQMPGLTLTPFKVEYGTEKFDLSVSLVETASGLKATFSYNIDLFEAATIARMMKHFQKLLEGLVADPGQRISQLPILSPDERHKVLFDFNSTGADFPSLCIHNLLEQSANRVPEATALICGDKRTSYHELNQRANQIAHYLIKLGAGPDVLVGVFMERTPDLVPAIFGVLKSGSAYVPLDPSYPRGRLAAILADSKAPIVLTQQSLAGELASATAKFVCIDSEWDKIARESRENPATQVRPDNLAYVLFTSGSTGRPKGVALEHHNNVTFVRWAQTVFTPDELAGVLFCTSIGFDMSTFEMFITAAAGGKIILAENPLNLPTLAAKDEVTLINTVPSAIAELVRANALPPPLKTVALAGEALPESLVEEIYRTGTVNKVYNLYGPTESGYSTSTLVPRGGRVTIGKPIANEQCYILDKSLNPLPVGVPGELYLAGGGVARGYFGRPDLTAERFIPNPLSAQENARMYRTGDLCRWLPDGSIEYLGRIDHQVKLRGFRIELGEIEAVLSQHPWVRECVVIVRDDTPGDKRLVAYVVPSPGHDVSIADLRSSLKESLPEYMIPGAIVSLEALPLTPNGKINRRVLPSPDWSQIENVGRVAARDQIEAMLIEIWQKVLGIPNIGVRDNFFNLGGNSLLAARLLSEAETLIGRQIPLSALFRGATVESLAQLIREGSEANPDPLLMEIQAGNGSSLPFFAVASPGVESLGYGLLARHMGPEQAVYKLQGRAPVVAARPFTEQELHSLAEEYIAAMRAVQPEGPYCFGGMCEGVQIAERMVLDLEAQGQEVGLFAIFDTWVLQHSQRPWLWRLDYYLQRLLEFRKMGLAEQFQEYKRAVKQRLTGKSPARTDWQQAYWPQDFAPPHFRAPIALFKRPKQPFYYVNDPQMGWGARTEGGVEIHQIDFHHLEILREPHVGALGEQLAACVKRASKRYAQSALRNEAASPSLSAATHGGTG